MRVSNIALVIVALALPLVPAIAQPMQTTTQVAPVGQTVPATLVRGTIDAIGYRQRDRVREVFVTMRVRGVTGTTALRGGEVVRLAYTCALDSTSVRACANQRNHPALLGAIGPVTLTMIPADVRADELPVPSMSGSTFRAVDGGIASAIVIGAYRGNPGPLTTTPSAMLAH